MAGDGEGNERATSAAAATAPTGWERERTEWTQGATDWPLVGETTAFAPPASLRRSSLPEGAGPGTPLPHLHPLETAKRDYLLRVALWEYVRDLEGFMARTREVRELIDRNAGGTDDYFWPLLEVLHRADHPMQHGSLASLYSTVLETFQLGGRPVTLVPTRAS